MKRSATSIDKPAGNQYRSGMTFATGLLAGAATSTLVPWEAFEAVAPGARLACLAGFCGLFVIFRLITAGAAIRKGTSIVMVAVGGLLMSGGAKVLPGSLAFSPVGIGAVVFLFGVVLLMRERHFPRHLKEEAIDRLLEDAAAPGGSDSEEPIEEAAVLQSIERLRALELLSETDPTAPQTKVGVGS